MTPRREYVFSQRATIHDVKAHLEERLRKELASLHADSLFSGSVEDVVNEIVTRYTMNIPVLDREGMVEMPRHEIQLEVPAFSQNRAFFGRGPHYVPATLFTLKIPFTGDRNLLRYPASGFAGHIPAELGDDAIYFTCRAEKPDPAAIQKEFDHQLSQIETALQFVRGPAEEWNNRLPSIIRPKVEQRHAQMQRNHELDLGYRKAPAASHPVGASAVPNQQKQFARYDFFSRTLGRTRTESPGPSTLL